MWGDLPVQIQAAIVAGLVSLVVTLLVEYAAKPALEARKDRILDGYRARRRVIGELSLMSVRLGMMWTPTFGHLPAGSPERQRVRDEVSAARDGFVEGTRELERLIAGGGVWDALEVEFMSTVIGLGRGVALSSRTNGEVHEILQPIVVAAIDLLSAFAGRQRVKAREAARTFLAELRRSGEVRGDST